MDAAAVRVATNEYEEGNLAVLIDWLIVFVGRSRRKSPEDTPEARRQRASKLAHERGGITKAASVLTSPAAAHGDTNTAEALRRKYPSEDPAAIVNGKVQAEQRAGTPTVDKEAQADVTNEPLGHVQGHNPEVEHLFDEATLKAIIKKANPQSAAGPSRLRYSHLLAALGDELVEEIAELPTLVFPSRILPEIFWTLHTSANLSTLGQKVRPVACGDVLPVSYTHLTLPTIA